MGRVLVVDDQQANLITLERILTREGWEVFTAPDGRTALEVLRGERPEVVVTDLKMPGMTGLELLKAIRTISPTVEVILMTAFGTVETAVDAMKEGAWDYVTKPLKRAEIVQSVRRALEKQHLLQENSDLKARLEEQEEFIGRSPPVQRLLDELNQIAPTEASVMLLGPSGSGKGLLARQLHARSHRSKGKLVTVNCGAIPEALLESELFGYEAGAFTGASSRKEGRFDLARGGTLFLDEITAMPLALQVKLLRVLQEGEYERVGGTKTLKTDVRIVCATNLDIEGEVAERRFREDLFYRINVIQLKLPSLAERREDVPLLALHFLRIFAEKNRKQVTGFSAGAMELLTNHTWPGNVRELQNCVERAVVLTREAEIQPTDLPTALQEAEVTEKRLVFEVGVPLKEVERRVIEATLAQCGGDRVLAGSILGITARTIYRRQAEWG